MTKIWKTINSLDIPYNDISECLEGLKKNDFNVSPWIEDIIKLNKKSYVKPDSNCNLYRIKLQDLGLTEPSKLKDIYKLFKSNDFKLVDPFTAIYSRFLYLDQPSGEWLRFSTPFNSMIDSDGVPHLPKLGKALGMFFIETYWSYPDAIFHPHNEFVVKKT